MAVEVMGVQVRSLADPIREPGPLIGPDQPWTDEHRRWALWAHLRLAADIARDLDDKHTIRVRAAGLAVDPWRDLETEVGWRRILRGYGKLTDARIDRTVRLVRALAEGRARLVSGWRVDGTWYGEHEKARVDRMRGQSSVVIIRVVNRVRWVNPATGR